MAEQKRGGGRLVAGVLVVIALFSVGRFVLDTKPTGRAIGIPQQSDLPGAWVAVSNNSTEGLNGGAKGSGTSVVLDPSSGQGSAEATLAKSTVALARSPVTSDVFGVQAQSRGKFGLVRMDPGALQTDGLVGMIVDSEDPTYHHVVAAMSFAEDGTLYGVSYRIERIGGFRVPVGMLVRIDTQTGVATEVGSLGRAVYSRGGTIADGKFQLVTSLEKVTREFHVVAVDLETGASTVTGGTGIMGRAVGVSRNADGAVYAVMTGVPGGGRLEDGSTPSESFLYAIDVGTGKADLVGSTGFHLLSSLSWMIRPVGCGSTTAGDMKISNTATVDSVSCEGEEGDAALCANGNVAVENQSSIDADLYSDGEIAIGSNATVTGAIYETSGQFEIPDVDTSAAKANNDNDSIGLTSKGNSPIDGDKFILKTTESITIDAGVYWFESIEIGNKGVLSIEGDVEFWVDGDIAFDNSDEVAIGSGGTLTIYSAGESVSISNTADVEAVIVAPYATVTIDNQGSLTGWVISAELELKNKGALHIDECIRGPE